jgi:hypothetical protein
MSTQIEPHYEAHPDMMSKQEALDLEREGRAALKQMVTGGYAFFVVLYKLQDGGAHVLRGYPNFGDYAADKFDDVSPENAKKMARSGRTLFVLLDAKKIMSLDRASKVIGTTGVRALSSVQSKYGTGTMLSVFDGAQAKAVGQHKAINEDHVKSVMLELVSPHQPDKILPAPEVEDDVVIPSTQVEHGELLSQLLDLVGEAQDGFGVLFSELEEHDAAKAKLSASRLIQLVADLPQALDLAVAELQGEIVEEAS